MNWRVIATLVYMIMLYPITVNAFTIGFDDAAAGAKYYVYDNDINSVYFNAFRVLDHSSSTWGIPHSGANVLGWTGSGSGPTIAFGAVDIYGRPLVNVQHFGAYYSTTLGTVLEMRVYKNRPPNGTLIQTIQIGSSTEAWDNKYIEVDSSAGEINGLMFQAASQGALSGFCLDDLTITPVPEPSSILALLGGLAGANILAWRRR